MLQFNKAQTTNTNAIWPDVQVTASIESGEVYLDFTQVYDKSTTDEVIGTLLNNPGVNGVQYLVFSVPGASLPAYSGQYTVNIYELIAGAAIKWIEADFTWANASYLWSNVSADTRGNLISTDRAYLSGSNEVAIPEYSSPNETGTYTTYNG